MKDSDKTREQLIEELGQLRRNAAARESLNKTAQRFGTEELINGSPLVIFIWQNKEGWPVEYVTDNLSRVFGYDVGELMDGTIAYAKIIHPDDLGRVQNEVMTFSSDDDCHEFIHEPYRIITKAGKVRWMNDRTYIKRNPQGEITHYQGVLLDITERKEFELKLLENEERLHSTFNAMSDTVMLHPFMEEGFGKFFEVNDTAVKRYGYTREEFSRLTAVDISVPVETDKYGDKAHRKSLKEKKNRIIETLHKAKSGEVFPVEINSSVITIAGRKMILSVVRDITERKAIEETLRKSFTQLQTIYKTLPVNIWATDAKGIIIFSEGKNLEAMGLSPEEIVGRSQFDVFKNHPESLESHRRCLSGEACDYDIVVNGMILHCVLTPIFDDKGNVLGINGISLDVTETRKTEDKLKQGSDRLKKLNVLKEKLLISGPVVEKLQTITDAVVDIMDAEFARIWMIKPGDMCDRNCRYSNPESGETICMDRSRCLHLLASSGIYPSVENSSHKRVPLVHYKIGQIAASDSPGFYSNDIVNNYSLIHDPDWAREIGIRSFAGYRLSSHNDEVIGVIVFFSKQKITRNDNAFFQTIAGTSSEVVLAAQAEENVRELQNYLSNIINSMPSMLLGIDSDGLVTQWNKTVEENTGITAEEAHGRKLSDLFPQMKSEMEKISKSIESRQIFQEQKRTNTINKNAVYEDMTIYPLITNGIQGAVIRIDNVSSEVRMQEMMIQSEKMLSVGGLAAGMAHEINNPLAGMLQTASALSNRLMDGNGIQANVRIAEELGTTMEVISEYMERRKVPRMLEIISESGKHVADIIENMLSFSRKSEAVVSTHDLGILLDKTLELANTDYDLKKDWDFKKIKITKDYAEDLTVVPCEGVKIQQVLLNIFRNGAQAMQTAKLRPPEFRLRAYNDPEKEMVCIEVEDNGPGMDEEVRKRVFEPFFTTKAPGVGTGLGLSVSYFIIVENHAGEMEVVTNPGEGTKFIIRLPLVRTNKVIA